MTRARLARLAALGMAMTLALAASPVAAGSTSRFRCDADRAETHVHSSRTTDAAGMDGRHFWGSSAPSRKATSCGFGGVSTNRKQLDFTFSSRDSYFHFGGRFFSYGGRFSQD